MSKYEDILDNESGDEEGFRINENYAARYDRWRSKEELEKLKARGTLYSSEEEESDEEPGDKDFGKPNNPEFDREFLLSLGTIYKHEKGDVDLKDVQFFAGDYRLEKEKEEKPMTLKDFERHVMVEREGRFEENEIDTRNSDVILKDAKKVKLDDGLDESDGDGDDLFSSGLFKVKEDSSKGIKEDTNEASENEAVDFVKGVNDSLSDTKNKDILETVKDKWNNEKLSKKDKWLVDFFLNKRYMAEGSDDEGYCNESFLDEEELSEEETTKESDPLATQYKFRHQEPGDFIKRHPRSVPESLRQKDERRKERREATKQRQVMKKEEKRKEIELLKILKYKEIEEKIDKIREASGNDDIDLGEIDLEADFDPDAHDAYMERVLGTNYYDDCNAEEAIPDFGEEKDDAKMYDNWTQASTSNEGNEENWEDHYYDDYNMDADYDEQNTEGVEKKKTKTRRKNRHQSKFARALEKKKPLFDPNEKDFASYFDEYYKLDFEDVIGGMPCRFKYRKVENNNFGLTTGEILSAQNADLNKWVGLKKIMQYDRSKELEVKERQMYGERAKHIHIKQKILPSLFDENPEDLAEREREKRRMRNLKKKQKKWKLREGIADDAEIPAAPEGTDVGDTIKEGEIKNEKKRPLEGSDENLPKRKQHKLAEETETLKHPTSPEDNGAKKKKKKHKKDIVAQQDVTSIKKKSENTTDDTVEQVDIEGEVIMKKKKKKKKKNQIQDTPSIPAPEIHETERDVTTDQLDIEEEDVVIKKKKKKKTKNHIQDAQNAPSEGKSVKEKRKKKKYDEQTEDIQGKPKKNTRSRKIKRKHYHEKHNKSIPYLQGISDARLEAYGQNPKKLKNRVIYGKEF